MRNILLLLIIFFELNSIFCQNKDYYNNNLNNVFRQENVNNRYKTISEYKCLDVFFENKLTETAFVPDSLLVYNYSEEDSLKAEKYEYLYA